VSGSIYEFFESAGENGWELCAAFPNGTKGSKRALAKKGELRECQDAAEEIGSVALTQNWLLGIQAVVGLRYLYPLQLVVQKVNATEP
jgi:hypothetical protein